MDIARSINTLLRARNMSIADFARRVGEEAGTVRQQLNRGSIPSRVLPVYARALGVSVDYLMGRGDDAPAIEPRAVAQRIEPLTIGGEEYAPLPVMDIAAAAGAGQLVQMAADGAAVSFSVFRMSWLRGVTSAPIDRIVVIRIAGDSMWPTLHHGDSVLVDTTVGAIGRDGIYVIRVGDEVQCKRCSRHPVSGALTIASDNSSYPTYSDIRPAGLAVLGRVIWTGRTM